MEGSYRKGLKLTFLTALVSGFAIFVNKFFVGAYQDPYLYTTVKNSLVALMLISTYVIFIERKTLGELGRRQWLKLASIGVVGGSIPFLLFFKGLSMTSAVNGAFIHKSMFIWVALLAVFFLKEKLNVKHLFAALTLLTANAVLIGINAYTVSEGDYLIFLATLLWALETIISKNALGDIKPSIVACSRMGFGSVVLLSFMASTGKAGALVSLTATQAFAALAASSILFLYVVTWYHGLRHIQASTATVVLLAGSPITSFLSLMFHSASLSISEIGGMVLLIAGVLAYVRLSIPTPTKQPTVS